MGPGRFLWGLGTLMMRSSLSLINWTFFIYDFQLLRWDSTFYHEYQAAENLFSLGGDGGCWWFLTGDLEDVDGSWPGRWRILMVPDRGLEGWGNFLWYRSIKKTKTTCIIGFNIIVWSNVFEELMKKGWCWGSWYEDCVMGSSGMSYISLICNHHLMNQISNVQHD